MKKYATSTISFVLLGILLALPNVTSAQRIPMKNATGPVERMHRRTIERQLTSELDLMKITMRLNDAQVKSFSEAAQHAINLEANRLADPQAAHIGGAGNELPEAVLEAVLKKATQRVGKFRVKTYKQDRLQRQRFHQQTGIDGFLVALDQTLVLSEQQVAQLGELLQGHWKEHWTPLGMTAGQSGLLTLRRPIQSLPQQQLRKFLSPSQWTALTGPDTTPFRTLMVRTEKVSLDKQKEQFIHRQRAHCENVGQLKLEEVADLCTLEPRQFSDLQEAIARSINYVVENQTKAFVELKTVGPANTDDQLMTYLTTHVSDQLDDFKDWRRGIRSTLNRAQVVIWRTRQDAREEMKITAAAKASVASLSQQFGFTGTQQIQLVELLRKNKTNTSSQDEVQSALLRLPNESMSEIFEEGQWLRLRGALDKRREQLGI